MQPTLSQVCTLNSPFESDIEDFAAGGCQAVELWLTKLEEYLKAHSVEDVRRLADRCGVTFPVASYQGGLLVSQGQKRAEAWRLFDQRLDLCRELGVGCIVVACDVHGQLTQEDVDRTAASMRELARHAGPREMRVALEFDKTAQFGNNLQTAVALIDDVGSPHLGLCLDAFHFYCGPSKPEDLMLLTADHLLHVQLSDIADLPREFAADGNRILPGDGDIPLEQLIQRLRQIDYAGPVSIELMNPQIWQTPALNFGEIGMTALRKVLGIASMED